MRFHILAQPRFPIPPEQLGDLAERASEWQEQYRDHIETIGMFPGGGGFAVVDVSDDIELHQMVLDMPFTPFSAEETRPFVDGQKGWGLLKQLADRRPVAAHA